MNGGQIMAIIIVAMVMIASVLRAKYTGGRRRHRDGGGAAALPRDDAETARLREEMKSLKERLAVLERITVEKENSLAREIEQLRDR
ncbi:MAG TPA: hypothetical protein VGO55_18345 [Allosphingosinicella sp.]|jgi:hypothetical protein|nr:hypothetical protein [Allosphingosinicella sp.]